MGGLVVTHMSMSLDGYVAGPHDTREHPLGEGGERLHDWLFARRTPRDAELLDEMVASVGAVVMGRRSYDLCEGEGGWGDGGPAGQAPCFVLTHRVPAPEEVPASEGTPVPEKVPAPAVFTFVTAGIETAVEQARAAAGAGQVTLHGASCVRQALVAGLLDEIEIHLIPVLLGGGVPLFAQLGVGPVELERTRVIETPAATHLRFRVRGRR